MKRVLFLVDKSEFSSRFMFPIDLNRRYFKDKGVIVQIKRFDRHFHAAEADCIVVLHECLESLPQTQRHALLYELRHRCDRLVWLDTSDSTGTTVFDVLPLVDLYLKKQLLADLKLYETSFYSLRYFSHFYHHSLGIVDAPIPERATLDFRYHSKLKIAWNILVGDVTNNSFNHQRYYFYSSAAHRARHISYRTARNYIPTVNYQREMIATLLKGRSDIFYEKLEGIVSHITYMREMREAKAVISPFGWGEICWRDAECWLSGAALIKPDMSHLVTWPNLYRNNVTYVPLDWDLANLDGILDELAGDSSRFLHIAEEGQAAYKKVLSRDGQQDFVEHVCSIINS